MSNELNRVSAAEAHALLGQGYCYLDVRTVEEYAAGHPVGAFNIPVMHRGQSGMTENSEFLQVVEATFAN